MILRCVRAPSWAPGRSHRARVLSLHCFHSERLGTASGDWFHSSLPSLWPPTPILPCPPIPPTPMPLCFPLPRISHKPQCSLYLDLLHSTLPSTAFSSKNTARKNLTSLSVRPAPNPYPPPPTPRSSSTTVRRRITTSAQFPSPTPRKPCSAPAISLMCASWVCLCVDVALGQSCGIRSCCSATPFTTELEHTWVQRIELSLVDLRISLRLHTTLPRTRPLLGLLYFPRGHVAAPTQLPVINARRSSSGLTCMC